MKEKLRDRIIDILIAAAIGGLITFLTELVRGLSGLNLPPETTALSGGGSAIAYVVRSAKRWG